MQTDFHSVLIIEYNGVGTMVKGYNVFVKLVKGKNIPIAIRVSKDDKERVTKVLCKFLNVQKLKKRKWYIKWSLIWKIKFKTVLELKSMKITALSLKNQARILFIHMLAIQ